MKQTLFTCWLLALVTSINLIIPAIGFSSDSNWEEVPARLPSMRVSKSVSNVFSNLHNLKGEPVVGNLAGSFSVDQDGSATYDITLKASPGSAGMTPEINLHYSSNSNNGMLGVGFSLQGLTAITRAPQNYTQNGQIHGVDFSNNDRFTLAGQQLVAITGSYGGDGTEYRTYIDSQARIVSHGMQGNGPASFSVQTKGGQTAYYGASSDSQILAQGKNTANIWALTKIVDQSGNYIVYHYQQDAANGAYYPSEIDYTGNDAAKVSPYNSIKFIYEQRPDVITTYTAGSVFKVSQRLKEIQAFNENTLIYDYKLNYEQSPNTGKSRIISIQECDGQGECFKPLNLTWQTNQMGWMETKQWTPPVPIVHIYMQSATNHGAPDAGVRFPNLYGNGLPEMVMSEFSTDHHAIQSNAWKPGVNGWQQDLNFSNVPIAFTVGALSMGSKFADVDGKGKDDLFQAKYIQAGTEYYNAYEANNDWVKQDNKILPKGVFFADLFKDKLGTEFLDISGSGRLAVVEAVNNPNIGEHLVAYQFNGATWQAVPSYNPPINFYLYNSNHSYISQGTVYANLTGSGLPDLLEAGIYHGAWINSGIVSNMPGASWQSDSKYFPPSNFRFVVDSIGGGTQDGGGRITSLLGDGLSDLVLGRNGNRLAWINTGVGFIAAPQYNLPVDIVDDNIGYPKQDQYSYDNGVIFEDVTGSGLPALLQCRGPSSLKCGAWLNENGTWVEHDEYAPPVQITDGYGDDDGVRFVDLLGTGFPDIVFNNGDFSGAWLNKAQVKPDIITNIQDALGDNLQIQYKPITDNSVYTKGNSAQYPNMDIQTPIWVVAQTSSDTDITPIPAFEHVANKLEKLADLAQTQHITSYHYANGIYNHLGLGFLGFGQMTTTDQATGISTVTTYSQDITNHTNGLPTASVTMLSNGTVINQQNSTTQTKIFGSGKINETYYLPYIQSATQIAYDLNGNKLSTKTTRTQIDNYNNPISITQTAQDNTGIYTTQTDNTYQNNITVNNWFLGELTSAQVISSAPYVPSLTRSTSYTYDQNTGLLLSSTTHNGSLSVDYLTKTYHRDNFGNITQTDISGSDIATRSEKNQYDSCGRFIVSKTNALNQTFTYQVDPSFGVIIKSTDPNGLSEVNQLDGFGRVIGTTHADGTQENIQYLWSQNDKIAPNGSVYEIIETQSASPEKISYHDELDREIAQTIQGFDGRYIWQLTNYDQLGRVIGKTIPFYTGDKVYVTTNQYDVLGRNILTINPDQTKIQNIYNGYTSTIINPNNQKTTRISNVRGNLLESIDNENHVTHYQYDAFNHLVQLTDSLGNVTSMTYDSLGRKISMQDSDRGHFTYQYDALGELVKQTDALSQTTKFQYDLLGRMTARTDLAGTSNSATSTWQYDTSPHGVGKLAQENGVSALTQHNNSVQLLNAAKQNLLNYAKIYSYDSLGRINGVTTSLNGQNYTETTSYDSYSRPLIVTDPDQVAIKNIYNQYGYLSQVVDANSGKSYYQINSMDAGGHILSEAHSNGLITTYSYDPQTNFLMSIQTSPSSYLQIQKQILTPYLKHSIPDEWNIKSNFNHENFDHANDKIYKKSIDGSSPVQQLNYTYDNLGNLLTSKDDILNIESQYQYDDLNRLIQNSTTQDVSDSKLVLKDKISNSSSTTYQYDALGNILQKSDIGKYTYGENGAGPHAVTSISGLENDKFSYDASGHQTQAVMQMPDGSLTTRKISYTSFDVPKNIMQSNSKSQISSSVSFYYDANRSRFMRQDTISSGSSTSTNTTLYLGNLEIDTMNNGASIQTIYKNYIGDTELITDSQGNAHRYDILKDNLGSTSVITDEQGNVVQRFQYAPFGEQQLVQESNEKESIHNTQDDRTSITRYGFTGQEELDVAGINLIHMNGRMYDPHLGRFLSADPTIQDPSNGQSLNRYTYCLNNPLAYTDPTGFSWWSSLWKSAVRLFHGVGHAIDEVISNRVVGTVIQLALDACSVVNPMLIPLAVAFAGYRAYLQTGSVDAGLISGAEAAGEMAVMYGVGNIDGDLFHVGGDPNMLKSGGWFGDAWMHGVAGGAINLAEGGDFKDGFLSAAVSQLMSGPISNIGSLDSFEAVPTIAARGAAAGLIGGTMASATGGNFENAAWTSAYGEMFNDALHAYRYHYSSAEALRKALGTNGIVFAVRPLDILVADDGTFDLNGLLSYIHDGGYHEEIFYTGSNGSLHDAGYFKYFGVVLDDSNPGQIEMSKISRYQFEPIQRYAGNLSYAAWDLPEFAASAYRLFLHNCQDYAENMRNKLGLRSY